MTTDTAQVVYPPADPVADAAALFGAMREPQAQPRDETGKFAPKAAPEPVEEEIEAAPVEEAAEIDAELIDVEEAADEAQPEGVKMPVSWSKDDAEHWNALPPEAQALIAEREGQRETAVNTKFQEYANARKASEAKIAEANANRDAYAEAVTTVLGMVTPVEPDPRDYGAGTGNYNREAFDLAVLNYRQQVATVDSLKQQRDAILSAQQEESQQAEAARFAEMEEIGRPKLLEAVPDIADKAKAPEALRQIVEYAVSQGIPESVFVENAETISSAELLLAWKASQYDKMQEAKTRVAPKAKAGAAPPVRPGVSTPRATQQQVALQKDLNRLASEGTIEAGAAVFSHFRK
ncbi:MULTISPECIES: hypothetical protein [Alphaproteobacteria]|uniref:hypothetical protein n=1 Tax=Sphingopyxis sp. TaxID=1908224 RepID=UPI004033E304